MNRAGFTLLEMIVALGLASVALLLAHAILGGVLDADAGLRRATEEARRVDAARAWVLEACHGLEVGGSSDLGFYGSVTEARFTTRVVDLSGTVAAGDARIIVDVDRIRLSLPSGTFVLVDSITGGSFAYLLSGELEGSWLRAWSAPSSAPTAIRITWSRAGMTDSLLCPIGGRG